MSATDHLAPQQLKLFLPQESAQDVGTIRMNADFNLDFARQMTERKQTWEEQHQHTVTGFLRNRLSRQR